MDSFKVIQNCLCPEHTCLYQEAALRRLKQAKDLFYIASFICVPALLLVNDSLPKLSHQTLETSTLRV